MIIDPLKLRDMRMPMITSPAMPSHMVPLSILSPSQKKLDEGGGRLVTAAPLETVHTVRGSSITYAKLCPGRPHNCNQLLAPAEAARSFDTAWQDSSTGDVETLFDHPCSLLFYPCYFKLMILEVNCPAVKSPTRERIYTFTCCICHLLSGQGGF